MPAPRAFLREVGPYVDVIIVSDDMGTQRGPLISPALYRKMVKPFHRRYLDAIRQHTGAKIHMHACGSIFDLVEDYIEIGVDVLNPMQVAAHKMAPEALYRQFHGRMAFWGGIDSQHTMPRGTPDDVRQAVRETIGAMNSLEGGLRARLRAQCAGRCAAGERVGAAGRGAEHWRVVHVSPVLTQRGTKGSRCRSGVRKRIKLVQIHLWTRPSLDDSQIQEARGPGENSRGRALCASPWDWMSCSGMA